MPQPPKQASSVKLEEGIDTCLRATRTHLLRELHWLVDVGKVGIGIPQIDQNEESFAAPSVALTLTEADTCTLGFAGNDTETKKGDHMVCWSPTEALNRSYSKYSNETCTVSFAANETETGKRDLKKLESGLSRSMTADDRRPMILPSVAQALSEATSTPSNATGRRPRPLLHMFKSGSEMVPPSGQGKKKMLVRVQSAAVEPSRSTREPRVSAAQANGVRICQSIKSNSQESDWYQARTANTDEARRIQSILSKARLLQSENHLDLQARSKLSFCLRLRLQSREHEAAFDAIMAVIIVANVLQIGVSADLATSWRGWLFVDTFFATAFTLEFCTKVWMHGISGYLCGNMWAWSAFDVFIVIIAISELILNFVVDTDDEGNGGIGFSVFRIVRLCRLTRILRVLRFPAFRDLVAMIDGLIYGTRTLFWSLMLLITPIYAVAIMMRETVGRSDEIALHYAKPFTSLFWSLFTVFRCIMGDCSSETGQPLPVLLTENYGWQYGFGFAFIVAFTSFGLFNVIIAIYVGNITAAARRQEASYFQKRLTDEGRYNSFMATLVRVLVAAAEKQENRASFCTLSTNSTQVQTMTVDSAASLSLTRDTFLKIVGTEEVQHILDELDVMPENRVGLFETLDADGGGSLSIGEILNGLTMLRGEPRRADTIFNGLILRSLQLQHAEDVGNLSGMLENLRQTMRTIQDDMSAKVPPQTGAQTS